MEIITDPKRIKISVTIDFVESEDSEDIQNVRINPEDSDFEDSEEDKDSEYSVEDSEEDEDSSQK